MSDSTPSEPSAASAHQAPEGPPVQRLIEIMRILRGPTGCPWDHKQTLVTLKDHLIEESHEVLDAIDSGDRAKLCDELGDLLLQVVFQAQVCTEEGAFTFDDVAKTIGDKLVRRHPHVFGNVKADTAEEVLKNWEAIKKTERGEETPRATLAGVPRSLPALHRAHLVQKRAARVGFDWDNIEGAVAKLEEELGEIREALAAGNEEEARAEVGDLLFAAVNVSRFLKKNPEELLEQTTRKFIRRFDELEKRVRDRGQSTADLSLAALDAVWDEVKAEERPKS